MTTEDTKKVATTNIEAKHKHGLTQRYEYLVVFILYQTNYASIRDIPFDRRPKQTWTYTWYLWWPNATKAEERPGDILPMSTLFNELGQDGWKLIASDITDSVVVTGDYHGWTEAGVPVLQRFIFIREVHI